MIPPMSPPPKSSKRGAGPACTASTTRPPRTRSTRCASFSKRSASPASPGQGPGAAARAVQPAAAPRRGDAGGAAGQRARAAQPGAGRLQPGQYRPFRAGAAALCAFHLADPPLCRSAGPSRADRRQPMPAPPASVWRGRLAGAIGRARYSTAEHISATERRAAAAERAALERYRARLLADAVGEHLRRRGSAASPTSACSSRSTRAAPTGWCRSPPCPPTITTGATSGCASPGGIRGRVSRLGDAASVRLAEADPIGGRLVFRIEEVAQTPHAVLAADGSA